ncbi:RNA-dependent RNA polymerase [Mobiluncus mulieris]|nr:RNA-dependent RNA polymerase [Mobiluncus mulieris]
MIQIGGGKTWLESVVCFPPPRFHEVPSGKLAEILQAALAGFPHSRAEWFEVRRPIGI